MKRNMNVYVTGGSGFIGRALKAHLEKAGCSVWIMRRAGNGVFPAWDVRSGRVERGNCPVPDGIIHLAGESIAQRWTEKVKEQIRSSRVTGTRLLCEEVARQFPGLRFFISASAIGYYGDGADRVMDESTVGGGGFLAEVCRDWEAAAGPIKQQGIRVVHPRIGLVLSPDGGALARMLPAFRMGLGGPIGQGTQYWSWIAMKDLVRAMEFIMTRESMSGPVNLVAPYPVTSAEFARCLGRPATGRRFSGFQHGWSSYYLGKWAWQPCSPAHASNPPALRKRAFNSNIRRCREHWPARLPVSLEGEQSKPAGFQS